jgi:hypothetical protein
VRTRYKFWLKEPRFEVYVGEPDGTYGSFGVGRLEREEGDE